MNSISNEESLALVEEIESHDAECTASEERFVQSCRQILVTHGTLDDEEVARLERIVRNLDHRAGADSADDDFEYEDDDELYGEDDDLDEGDEEDGDFRDEDEDDDFDDFDDEDDDAPRAGYEDE